MSEYIPGGERDVLPAELRRVSRSRGDPLCCEDPFVGYKNCCLSYLLGMSSLKEPYVIAFAMEFWAKLPRRSVAEFCCSS
jgi:hypothetical protein